MKSTPKKPQSKPHRRLTFQSKLENIAKGMEYYAVSVPLKTTQTLKARGPVPVYATVNGSERFLASLYPVGGGRHYLRIRNAICKSVSVKTGDRVTVKVTVRDRNDEVSIPPDLKSALQEEGVLKDWDSLPIGKRSFLLRLIDKAAKPPTRAKRVRDAVEEAHKRRERSA